MILLRNTTYNNIESGACKINYIYINLWDAVTHPCPNDNHILAKPFEVMARISNSTPIKL